MGLFDWFKAVSEGKANDVSPLPSTQTESAEIGGLDFQAAMVAHQQWKARLQNCINGIGDESLDPRVVCRDDKCVLGKWINGQGAMLHGDKPVFSQLKIEHAQFHAIASEVLLGTYSGRTAHALEQLNGVFTQSSLRTQRLIAKLFVEVQESDRLNS